MIQNYNVEAADCFDNQVRWFRCLIYVLDDILKGKRKGSYERFLLFEIYLSEQSLIRKKNKLYLKGILNDHKST